MKDDRKRLAQCIAVDDFVQAIKFICNGIGDINSTDRSGATLLMRAVVCNDKLLVEKLIKIGADVNLVDDAKFNALHFASQDGRCEIAMILIKAGVDINAQDEYGNSPLLRAPSAATVEGKEMVELLLKNGANALLKNNYDISYENMLKQ